MGAVLLINWEVLNEIPQVQNPLFFHSACTCRLLSELLPVPRNNMFQAAIADKAEKKIKVVQKTPHGLGYMYSRATRIQAGTHSGILCKSGNGRHVYTYPWPRPL